MTYYELYFHKLPRKDKKRVLGLRIGRQTLRKMIAETSLGLPIKTMFQRREAIPHGLFCPHCGCNGYIGTGNRAEYPDHWEYFKCMRCGETVGYIDNSPFIHALECAEENFDPIF